MFMSKIRKDEVSEELTLWEGEKLDDELATVEGMTLGNLLPCTLSAHTHSLSKILFLFRK